MSTVSTCKHDTVSWMLLLLVLLQILFYIFLSCPGRSDIGDVHAFMHATVAVIMLTVPEVTTKTTVHTFCN